MKSPGAPPRAAGAKGVRYIMKNTPHRRGSQARLERRGPTVEGFSTPTDPSIGLIIELVDTADMPDGQPLPPLIVDGVVWCVARRQRGHTRWRQIALAENPAIDRRQAARDFNPAAATTHKA
jgi:hypothetical protein